MIVNGVTDDKKQNSFRVQEVIENEVYSIGFTSGTNQLKIYVYLDATQRNEKPKLIVNPLVDHPWVNATTGEIFGAPGLLNVKNRNYNFIVFPFKV